LGPEEHGLELGAVTHRDDGDCRSLARLGGGGRVARPREHGELAARGSDVEATHLEALEAREVGGHGQAHGAEAEDGDRGHESTSGERSVGAGPDWRASTWARASPVATASMRRR